MSIVEKPSALEAFKAKWLSEPASEQYAAKKKLQKEQSHLFDSHEGLDELGAGRWITIGGGKNGDGSRDGGHPVFVGPDGEMKTGRFAGKTMEEAFGEKKVFDAKAEVAALRESGKSLVKFAKEKGYSPEERKSVFEEFARQNEESRAPKPPSQAQAAAMEKARKREEAESPVPEATTETKPNSEAKPGDQLGLFGEATSEPKKSKPFEPTLLATKGKAKNLFDTHGEPNQMDMFGDGVMPDDLVYKPKEESQEKKDVLLSDEDLKSSEKPTANFNLTGGGKALVTNELLNEPAKLNGTSVANAFKSVDPREHDALNSHIATVRPDLAERAREELDIQSRIRAAKNRKESTVSGRKRFEDALKKDLQIQATSADGLSKLLKPESMEAIKNAREDSLGHFVEQVSKIAPGADRSSIRKAIDEYRKSQGVEPEDRKSDGKITMTVNSSTPHADELRHALNHIE